MNEEEQTELSFRDWIEIIGYATLAALFITFLATAEICKHNPPENSTIQAC